MKYWNRAWQSLSRQQPEVATVWWKGYVVEMRMLVMVWCSVQAAVGGSDRCERMLERKGGEQHWNFYISPLPSCFRLNLHAKTAINYTLHIKLVPVAARPVAYHLYNIMGNLPICNMHNSSNTGTAHICILLMLNMQDYIYIICR